MIEEYKFGDRMIAFFPYTPYGTDYIVTIQQLLQTEFEIIDYNHLKYGLWDIEDVSCIYLNWIENSLDEDDRTLLKKASSGGVKIVWTFHNKTTHDIEDKKTNFSNFSFLADISDVIVVHSKNSGAILASQYGKPFQTLNSKIVFVPHPDYIGDYKSYVYPDKNLIGKTNHADKFTFAFVGQIRPYKNIEILIKAYKEISPITNSRLVIAGNAWNLNYLEEIRGMCRDFSDVLLYSNYIGSLEMKRFLDAVDVLVLPYSLDSSMNSGTMIMAFSYGKTVVIPDICMADDFSDELIYKYHYRNEVEHIEELRKMMLKVYKDGSENVKQKGDKLFNIVSRENTKETVRRIIVDLCDNA